MNDLIILAILFGLVAATIGIIRICDGLKPRDGSSKAETKQ